MLDSSATILQALRSTRFDGDLFSVNRFLSRHVEVGKLDAAQKCHAIPIDE